MIGPAPKTPYTGKLTEGDVVKAKKQYRFPDYKLAGLKPDTDDQLKMMFEKWKNAEMKRLIIGTGIYDINLKDPYYTWEGKIVERSSLAGRELPLAIKSGNYPFYRMKSPN